MPQDFLANFRLSNSSHVEERAACPSGLTQCAGGIFCYNLTAGDECCQDGSYCPAGSYCWHDRCCLTNQTLEECGGSSSSSFTGTKTTIISTIATGPPQQTTSDQQSGSSSPPRQSRDRGLSTAAKAGIGAGVGAGVLLIVALILVILFRRRKQRKSAEAETAAAYVDGKAELPADGEATEKEEKTTEEMGLGNEVYEKGGEDRPAEMENGARYELPGDWHGYEAQSR